MDRAFSIFNITESSLCLTSGILEDLKVKNSSEIKRERIMEMMYALEHTFRSQKSLPCRMSLYEIYPTSYKDIMLSFLLQSNS